MDTRLDTAQIPKLYADYTLNNFYARHRAQNRALACARDFIRHFNAAEEGLWITGPAASGKTHLVIGILRALLERGHLGIRFYDALELLRRLDPRTKRLDPEARASLRAEVTAVRLLVLDDLGGAEYLPSEIETLNHLAIQRSRARRPMILTSRGGKRELSRRLGDGAVSWIVPTCTRLSLAGDKVTPPDRQPALEMRLEKLREKDSL